MSVPQSWVDHGPRRVALQHFMKTLHRLRPRLLRRCTHAKLMLPSMACSEKCTAFPCVAKLAGAAFPACQAAIGEFNALAAVQAWRAQPAEATEAGTSGATGGAADEGGSGMQVEA